MASNTAVPDVTDPSKVPCCKCKDEEGVTILCVLRTSNTEKNKNRSFFTCSKGQAKGCGFFCWAEDVIVDPKTGLAKRKYIPATGESLQKKTKLEQTALDALTQMNLTIQERLKVQEEKLEELEQRLSKVERERNDLKIKLEQNEEIICSSENELLTPPPAKTQKAARGAKGFARPRMLE